MKSAAKKEQGEINLKALALFSGGLDSALAIKIVKEQGIEVVALNFVSYFFGGSDERSDRMARDLGVQLEYIDFKEEQKKIVLDPPSGHGKNLNPCIDCHALMIKIAGRLLEKYEASFIITGEVLGERPMSQNSRALQRVAKLSGMEGYIVRPLSAKLMEETIPEKNGWIDREKLLSIEGRSRKPQMQLVEKYKIKEYPSPGGGCLLTEEHFTKRLIFIRDDDRWEENKLFGLVRSSRFLRMDKDKYLFVGRDEADNQKLKNYNNGEFLFIEKDNVPGPVIVGAGEFTEEDKMFAAQLFSRYCKHKGKIPISVKLNNEAFNVPIVDFEAIETKIKEYIV